MTLWVSVPVVYTNYFQFSWPSVIAIAFVSAHFEAWDKGIVDYHCCVDMSEYSVQCMRNLELVNDQKLILNLDPFRSLKCMAAEVQRKEWHCVQDY